jgi:hypothetical protein
MVVCLQLTTGKTDHHITLTWLATRQVNHIPFLLPALNVDPYNGNTTKPQ